jgi:hypothetical protein
MPAILQTFRDKAEDIMTAVNRQGGVRATIDGLRKQMAEGDRRRAIKQARAEIKRLEDQITEMITAVGIQAVGLQQAGRLNAPELQPLCQHIVDLKSAVGQQQAELAKMEEAEAASQSAANVVCPACGKPWAPGGTFCPYCGATLQVPGAQPAPAAAATTPLPSAQPAAVPPAAPQPAQPTPARRVCANCGTEVRPQAKFCGKCGQAV